MRIPSNKLEPGNDHVHTWRSDGELTELEVILYALTKRLTNEQRLGSGVESDLRRIELTDHDTVMAWSPRVIREINEFICGGVDLFPDGHITPENPKLIRSEYVGPILSEAGYSHFNLNEFYRIRSYKRRLLKCGPDLEIGKGVELTARMGHTFHVLGLLMPGVDDAMEKRMAKVCEIRRKRAAEMIEDLYRDDYFFERTLEHLRGLDPSFSRHQLDNLIGDKEPLTYADVKAVNPNSPSRLTIGFLLWKKYGSKIYWTYDSNGGKRPLEPKEVRDIYMERSPKSRYNIPSISFKRTIKEILRNNGIPVLAHPNEGIPKENYTWLEKGFDAIQEMGYDVDELVDKRVIAPTDVDYARKKSLIELFIKWGLCGIEDVRLPHKFRSEELADFSADEDYHGPNVKSTRSILRGYVPSTTTLLNLVAMKEVHNELYKTMQFLPEYEKWRERVERTNNLVAQFPSRRKRTEYQQRILDVIPRKLEKNISLKKYLEMITVYDPNSPNLQGTVLELEIAIQDSLRKMIYTTSYYGEQNNTINIAIDRYLRNKLDKHQRIDILQENLPFLHNIGKVLTFGAEEVEKDGKVMYKTTFEHHDRVGAEIIDHNEIRDVLRNQQGLTDKEIDHIRDVALYHVKVHDAVYTVMELLEHGRKSKNISRRTEKIIMEKKLKPEVIMDSLLLIKAAGKMSYARDMQDYPTYTRAIDELIKVCVPMLPK
ncbi:MAG: hypothetical protein U9O94_03115 [Nanoarchaeota archaeon]|nr:hypothetical protein [Nanoarchaeota archaeon]